MQNTKLSIITKFQTHEKDTGSPLVQIGIINSRISQLQKHFKTHKKDNSSRKGLLKLVGQRRRLIEYLKTTDLKLYNKFKTEIDTI